MSDHTSPSLPPLLGGLIKLEWAFCAIGLLIAYGAAGGSWLLFGALVLVPDVSMLGYYAGPRIGALCYNALHLLLAPLLLGLAGWMTDSAMVTQIAVVWLFHIAFDRAMGYGLKLSSSFRDTHLGRIGRSRRDRPFSP